jgi:peptidoglycan/xylan/chitin deacetylase (PgdA/CDA1 family)
MGTTVPAFPGPVKRAEWAAPEHSFPLRAMPAFASLRRLAPTLAACLLAGCGSAPSPLAFPEPAAAAAEIPASPALDPVPAPVATPVVEPPLSPAPPVAAAALAEPVVPRERTRAVVLVYHLFGAMDSPLAVTPAAFAEQLDWLAEHHVTVIPTSDLLRFLDGDLELPEHVAVITIDDGHTSVYRRAFPLLEKHGFPFALALNTGAIEGGRREAVTWKDVRAMLATGLCEVESHSHIHGHMDRLTPERNRVEAELSRSILEERIGVRPEAFVFPFGGHDAKVRRIVEEAGYRAAFAAWGHEVTVESPRFALPRVGVRRSTTLADFARFFGEPS